MWKFLRTGAVSPFTGHVWTPGRWTDADGTEACAVGIHACRAGDLPYWLSDELWRIELADPVTCGRHKVVSARARLLDRVEAWTPERARQFGEVCVRRTAVHAAAELRRAGREEQAEQLLARPVGELGVAARQLVESMSRPAAARLAKMCGYVVDAVDGLDAYPAAALAYIAARAANHSSGPPDVDLYAAERTWQSRWLVEALSLPVTG